MAKAAAKTGVSPTALIAIEQYFPKNQRIILDGRVMYGWEKFYKKYVVKIRSGFSG